MSWIAFPHGFLVLAISIFASAPAVAEIESPASTSLSAPGAREDLELTIAAVEAGLPDIYWHQTRQQWSAAKADARERVSRVTDSEALWRVLRPLVGQIGEGHLGLKPSEAMQQHFRDAPRFPLDLLWTEEGAFVLAGYGTAADVPEGARLIAVDGVDAVELLRAIVSATAHDGHIRTGSMRDASGRGFASILYRLRGAQPVFHVVLESTAGRIERDLPAVPRLARPAEGSAPPPLPTLEWLDDRTAYLNVPTFSNARIRAAGTTFPEAIHALFVQIHRKGARNLVLDLRENGGGSEPNESILFSYLVKKPLKKYAAVEARGRHLVVTSSSGKRFETDVFDDEDEGLQRPIGHGRLARRNTPPEGLMSRWAPFDPVFDGRLIVLAGGNTFSGGAELASMLYHTKRAVFVGEEVGGADAGNTSGRRWAIELPNSGMLLTVPLLQFRMNWSRRSREHGVRPHCPVSPEVTHFGDQRDAAWRVAVAISQQRWQRPADAGCPSAYGHLPRGVP